MMPALPRFSEFVEAVFSSRFLFQRSTISPMRMPWSMEIAKIGSQSRKGCPSPKIARKLSRRILKQSGKPSAPISSNLEVPPARRFMSMPKKIKLGIAPYQNLRSLVASIMPLPANTNSSSHFLQFITLIIT